MARNFSELRRIAAVLYREAVFQSFYSLKRGGRLPTVKSPAELRELIKWNNITAKVITTIFMGAAVAMTAFISKESRFPGVSPAAGMAVMVGLTFLAVFFIIAVMSLDMVTGFVAAKAIPTLVLLPLSKAEAAVVTVLGFARLFDLQLATAILVSGLIYLLRTGSFWGTLTFLVGLITVAALAVTVALGLATIFYTKVLHQPGGGLIKNLVRLVYLLGSILPGVGMFLFFSYQAQLGRALLGMLAQNSGLAEVFGLVYPMSFGFLAAAATGLRGLTPGMLAGAGVVSAFYTGLAALGLRWTARRLRALALAGMAEGSGGKTRTKDFRIRPTAPWLGLLRKDLRLVFRSPSEAALFLMPVGAVIPWAVSMGIRGRLLPTAWFLGVFVGFMSLAATAALFSVDVVGASFLRTLPVRPRWFLAAKATVGAVSYTVSMSAVIAVAALAGRGETGRLALLAAAGLPPTTAGALATAWVLLSHLRRGAGRTDPFLAPGRYLAAIGLGTLMIIGPLIAAKATAVFLGGNHFLLYLLFGLAEAGLMAAAIFRRG